MRPIHLSTGTALVALMAAGLLMPTGARAAAPTCEAPAPQSVLARHTITLPTPTCTDADGDAITIEFTTLPTHGTLDPPGALALATPRSYTANADAAGRTESLTFVARANNETSAAQTLEIRIDRDNAPVCQGVSLTVESETALPLTIDPCSDGDDDDYTILVDQPAHGRIDFVGDEATYVSDPGFVGLDSFTFLAQDETGRDSNIATATIFVTQPVPVPQPNRAPVCRDFAWTVPAGATVALPHLPCNDPDGDPFTVTVAGEPQHGRIDDAARTYTPSPGFVGEDTFGIVAKDDGGSESTVATVHVTVAAAAGASAKRDTRAPTLTVMPVHGQRLAGVLRAGLKLRVTVSERSTLSLGALVDRATARRLGLKPSGNGQANVGTLSRSLTAGRTTVTLKLSPKAARKLKHAARLTLRIRATATDAAGNSRTVSRKLTLRARAAR